MQHFNSVILAGGSGTRLWPLSTPSFPKQFLPLPSGKSMIQETQARVAPLASEERSWVVTGHNMIDLVHEHLPSLPLSHLLGEPMGRNSATAICWAAETIVRKDPEAILGIFSADHVIQDVDALRQALLLAYDQAQRGYLVTIGLTPTRPETGYGYICYGDKVSSGHNHHAYKVLHFVEKPDLATAQAYLDDGHYVWNGGIFVWKADTILSEMREHLPDTANKIKRIVDAMGTAQEQATLNELWPSLQSISIDYGILEKTRNLIVIPAQIGWNDVGNWEQYGALFPSDGQGVRAFGTHQGLGSQNVVIYNNTDRRVFTIGLEDVIVVEMEDMTVICHKNHVQRVKELAEQQNRHKA
jgi:mannose-1-phosphate guanylyltransferase/mannose-6-phosphate isomerase